MTRHPFVSLALLALCSTPLAAQPLTLSPLTTVKTGVFRSEDPRYAEINAFDAAGKRIFIVNPAEGRIDVIDASTPTALSPLAPVLPLPACHAALGADCPLRAGLEPNSVAVSGSWLAVAVANAPKTDRGHAVLFRLTAGEAPRFVAAVEVGAGPDMVTFTDDGAYVLTADEGEPSGYGPTDIDPEGSVSIIELARLGTPRAVRRVTFERFDIPEARARLIASGVRIFGPRASVSQDLEPEYVATRSNKAYVTLQENNALAIINIAGATVEKIVPLGLKPHDRLENAIDVSDRDGGIFVRSWPVAGLYQPDAIDTFEVGGRTFLITANEGDARDYRGYAEEARVGTGSYVLDPAVFPDAPILKLDANLGRLTVSRASGDLDGDGDYDRIDVFGGRSVSIRDQQGRLVWDSASLFERLAEANDAAGINLFNTDSAANARDNRSDNKGVEPEAVVVGHVNGRPYAFIGLERDGGIVVLDLSTPEAPRLVTYVNRRSLLPSCNDTADCGDLGPEGLTFVAASDSPTGRPLLIVSNEVSSTTTVWEVQP
jgi:DNA-binding beta-propeller fold protein YncE